MFLFSAGAIICVPTRDETGAVIATPTPVKLATLQDIAVDMSVDLKELHGEKRFAVAVGHGKGKIEVKGKYGDINAAAIGLYLGASAKTGLKAMITQAAATVPATSTYTIDSTSLAGVSGVTFVTDLGVYYAADGVQFTRVATAPAAGQYSVNTTTGVYTFASADASKDVLISAEFKKASGGTYFDIKNNAMGLTPKFALLLQNQYDGNRLLLKLNSCTSSSFGLPYKNDDWAMSDFNAKAMEDAAGNIGYLSFYGVTA